MINIFFSAFVVKLNKNNSINSDLFINMTSNIQSLGGVSGIAVLVGECLGLFVLSVHVCISSLARYHVVLNYVGL